MSQKEFLQLLMKNLIRAKNKFPDQYGWSESEVFEIFRQLVQSFRDGTYSRHAIFIQWTCKEYGIANDRKSIDQLFKTKE